MTTRTLYPTRKDVPAHLRCARSACKRRAIVEPGVTPQVCLAHAKKRGKSRSTSNRREFSPLIGRSFQSGAERRRGEELAMMEKAGEITDLKFQVRFPLVVAGITVCGYIADYTYTTREGVFTVADCKGFETDIFRIKAKLFRACYGYDISIYRPPTRGR